MFESDKSDNANNYQEILSEIKQVKKEQNKSEVFNKRIDRFALENRKRLERQRNKRGY